ncbi:adenylate/guanylate cyclase domain-containing protein [Conexibacter sp. SYSU D00693]|uniref:adenylate/guanylate cyclase domain-containing protein n=1 Tax=Conexibacter sp. SYSU D00693 TaxID=2812560 RepID=UPI00196A525A|nr:adenylate/guanylate cyclase domain-containing protein [Conexibacter sp. SYSU D00693]
MPDWAAEGLLDGLEGDARAERAELLDWLHHEGFSLGDLRRSTAEGLVLFLPAERLVMGGPARLTLEELAERSGLDVDALAELRRALGLPVPELGVAWFADAEVGAAAPFSELGLDADQVNAVARVLGRGMAQTAQAMRAVALELVLAPGATELELAQRYAAAVEGLMPHVGPVLEAAMRMHLRNMVRSEAVVAEERVQGRMPGAREVGVAFADLVGFTRMGEEVQPEEVGRVATRLEQLAGDVVAAPVRLVKTIGDAAMLVCEDPAALVSCSLDLVEAVDAEGEGFPQVRVGIAHGAATQRGGDWFGRPVNLASRVTSIARAGSVLTTEDARAEGPFRWSFAGERRVKGVGAVKLFRVRRDA